MPQLGGGFGVDLDRKRVSIHEMLDIRFLLSRLRPRSRPVLVDVGAHTGAYSLVLAAAHPELSVLAFEPLPYNYFLLRANIEANRLSQRIKAWRVALADLRQDGRIQLHSTSSIGRLNSMAGPAALDYSVDVQVHLLDALLRNETRVDVLKIDAEGADVRVLEGAMAVIESYKPDILAELTLECFRHTPMFTRLTNLGYGMIQCSRSNTLMIHHSEPHVAFIRAVDTPAHEIVGQVTILYIASAVGQPAGATALVQIRCDGDLIAETGDLSGHLAFLNDRHHPCGAAGSHRVWITVRSTESDEVLAQGELAIDLVDGP